MVYIIENNGVYGLTKGQFSATADKGQKLKYAGHERAAADRHLPGGAGGRMRLSWRARSPATPSRCASCSRRPSAINGTAVLDIISPCVTFNNHDESTKSYAYGKEHEERMHEIDFMPAYEEIQVDYEPGSRADRQAARRPDDQAEEARAATTTRPNKWRALEMLEEAARQAGVS